MILGKLTTILQTFNGFVFQARPSTMSDAKTAQKDQYEYKITESMIKNRSNHYLPRAFHVFSQNPTTRTANCGTKPDKPVELAVPTNVAPYTLVLDVDNTILVRQLPSRLNSHRSEFSKLAPLMRIFLRQSGKKSPLPLVLVMSSCDQELSTCSSIW